jgi:squalene synthase HpnC
VKEKSEIEKIYSQAVKLARSHYENFPVVSFLIPKNLVPHIAIVYMFARKADDIADEGNLPDEKRLALLEQQKEYLTASLNNAPPSPFWKALANTIEEFQLTSENFYRLLDAFSQDAIKKRYATKEELLKYCENSANPVGRIILEFFNFRDKKIFELSDKICTALQLTNFWQDVSLDLQKGRIYIPQETFEKFNYSEDLLFQRQFSEEFQQLMKYEINFTEKLFYEGKGILNRLHFRLKAEINATILGGLAILKKIEKNNFNVLNYRVKLTKKDFLSIFVKTFLTLE